MRTIFMAFLGGLLSSAVVNAAATPGSLDLLREASCEHGRIEAPAGADTGCSVEGDVAQIAAELLVVKFGSDAPAFAASRSESFAAADDEESSAFWRGVGELAAERLRAQSAHRTLSKILSD
jgi:hypothetical protein